eukprot:957733-Rhodomonas_salina.3
MFSSIFVAVIKTRCIPIQDHTHARLLAPTRPAGPPAPQSVGACLRGAGASQRCLGSRPPRSLPCPAGPRVAWQQHTRGQLTSPRAHPEQSQAGRTCSRDTLGRASTPPAPSTPCTLHAPLTAPDIPHTLGASARAGEREWLGADLQ